MSTKCHTSRVIRTAEGHIESRHYIISDMLKWHHLCNVLTRGRHSMILRARPGPRLGQGSCLKIADTSIYPQHFFSHKFTVDKLAPEALTF